MPTGPLAQVPGHRPGVSVGVSQGLSPPTSKVTVEIEVRPHLTVGGEAGQSGSTGIGLNYNYDY